MKRLFFGSDFMCNKDIKGLEILKVLCTNNLLKSAKNWFFNKNYTFTICVGRVWIVIGYFLFEKQTFIGLLKVIGLQILFFLFV